MRIRITVPREHVDEETLGAGLEASSLVAQRQVESGSVPPLADAIESGQVKWRPEPAGQGFEGFDLPEDVMARGWGDCDDLASWWCAELRSSGKDPDAKAVVYESKPGRWHAVVERGDGSRDDPSRWAGMGKPGGPLPVTEPISDVSCVGFTKTRSGATRARWDVPLGKDKRGQTVGVALQQAGADPYEALYNASSRALGMLVFWGADEDTMRRMHAIVHMLSGKSEEDFAAMHGCGYDRCGDFVGALAERLGCGARVGALKATMTGPSASDVANIAATIIDPLGLRNMIAPLASQFVSNYAGNLAHGQVTAHIAAKPGGGRAASASYSPAQQGQQLTAHDREVAAYREARAAALGTQSAAADTSTASDDGGGDDGGGGGGGDDGVNGDDACPAGYNWVMRGGVWICVPKDASLSGRVGAARRGGRAPAPRSPSRSSSRGPSQQAQSSQQSQDDQAYDPTQESQDFQTDDTSSDYDTEQLPTYKWDEQTGLLTPVVGIQGRLPAGYSPSGTRGSSSTSRSGARGGSRSSGARGSSTSRSGASSSRTSAPNYGGSQYGQYGAQSQAQQPYEDGYGGYGPFYGQQQQQDQSYYGGGYAQPYQDPSYGPQTYAQPQGYGAGQPQYYATQQGYAYDPASGSMQPYFPGDSGDPGDPNDPNSLYSKSRMYGSAVPDEWGGYATPTAWGIQHAQMMAAAGGGSAANQAAQAAATEAYDENEYA